jgi:hypothetical protein
MSSPANGADQRLAFANADECRAWIAAIPIGNPVQAQAQLLRQLNLLNRQTMADSERLVILELLRKPVLLVQEEGSRRFVGKPLPLVPPEQAAFDATQAVWRGQLAGYLRCVEATVAGDATLKSHLALLVERALDTLAAAQFDIWRTGFQATPENWRTLHELYRIAEEAGVAEQEVEDKQRLGKRLMSPRALYVEVLLIHAANPHELPVRQLGWVARWARRWAVKVNVLATAPVGESTIKPLYVDLASSEPAGFSAKPGAAASRWLDTAELRLSLKRRLSLLDKGTAPSELQLGEDCTQPACGQLLKRIYRRWCKGSIAPGKDTQAVSGTCELIAGVEAIHYYLSGRKPFRQPGFADDEALRRDREEIATFGRVASRQQEGFTQQQGFRTEEWQIVEEWQMVEEAATGIHVWRTMAPSNTRIGQGQLMALRPADAQNLLLGCLRWAMVTSDSQLHAGILVIPGQPEPMAVRIADIGSTKESYRPGFLLPAITTLGSSATIIVPPGYFKSRRIVEVVTATRRERLRLLQQVDRGVDFDRASYEMLP